jgi:DtxR family transcriptional regulator, Mn-dependent transcriptional regulator
VEYEKHRGVRLSSEGQRRALEVLRHHRLIETFLYQILDFPIEEVHDEAERLEHFISERFEERVAAKLGNPKFDPHGHCIPAMNGKMPKQRSKSLASLERDGEFVVESVSDRDSALLKQLKDHGITPGSHLRVTRTPREELILQTDDRSKPMRLSLSAAGAVRIRSLD